MSAGTETEGAQGFLAGGGELARLIAAHDWAATSLGPLASWPEPVKTVVGMLLRSPLPIVTLWGEPGVMIYNDAYSVFAGGRHPQLLGSNVREGWPEVADFNDHVVKEVFRAGRTLSYEDQELILHRSGRPEPVWMNLDYSPVLGEDGMPIGVIAIVVETTEKILASRRLLGERTRLQQMYEQSPSFMALLDGPEHRFVLANPAYHRLVADRSVVGETLEAALPETVHQGYKAILDQVYASGKAFTANSARFLSRDGPGGALREHFLDFVYQPISGADGHVDSIFVEGVDVTDRVLAQEAIQASEARFRTLAQSVPNHVWIADAAGRFNWFNERLTAYAGEALAALPGEGWRVIVHLDDLTDVEEAWAASLSAGDSFEREFRIRRADGQARWHLVRAVPIRAEDGRLLSWIGTNTDVHEQKVSQAETVRDRDRLWSLSQDLLLVCDYAGLITAVNPSATRLLGWRQDEMVGAPLSDFIHPDDLPSTAAQLARLSDGVTVFAYENRYRSKSGDYRLIDWTAVPDAGRIHAVGRDITDQRRLARDRERIWTLSPVLKVVTDAIGRITAVNPSWTKTLGWTAADSIGKRSADFMAPDEEAAWAERIRTLGGGAVILEYQTAMITKTGDLRRIAWTSMPDDGSFYGFGRDVTAEVEAAETLAATEEALRQSQKMEAVGQLTGGIAHDFNNLLQGITGSLELIERRVAQGRVAEIGRFITGATTAANRAASLTHRLLAFSRRQPLDPRPVRSNPLIASMEDLLRRTIGERIELDLVLADDLWLTLCDPNQLENAILNLVINARDAMPEGGRLTIETCNAHLDRAAIAQQRDVKPGHYVCICVTDTGTGMTPDVIERAFEPFYTTKPIGQGTGLGLSMIYGFARQSEGYAKIASEVGQGTTFRLYLPRYRGAMDDEESPPAADQSEPVETGEVVLVVEDEPVVRGLIVETLAELGYQAVEAADGPRGLEVLQSRQRIDLLVTDIGLPGLNGRQVADAGRAIRPGLKVLFMTGYAENAALASGFLEPGMAMITKPFAMDALAGRVRAIMED